MAHTHRTNDDSETTTPRKRATRKKTTAAPRRLRLRAPFTALATGGAAVYGYAGAPAPIE